MMMGLALAALAAGQDLELKPELQVRPRLEVDSVRGSQTPGELVSFVNMRSRIGMGLTQDVVSMRVVVSDVRFMGEATDSRRSFSANGLDVRIATASWAPGALKLTVGRMEEPLLNQRLVAIANWRPEGRVFDGVRALWDKESLTLDLRAHLLDEGDTVELDVTDQATPGDPDAVLGVASLQYRTEPLSIAPNAVMQAAPDLLRVTTGVLANGNSGIVDYSLEAYYQSGAAADTTLAAAMVAAELGVKPVESVRLAVGADVLSGDGDLTDDRATSFNTVYGANHKFYGHMDMAVFYAGGFRDGQGLVDAFLRGHWTSGSTSLRWDQHLFAAPAPTDGALLATEPDLQIRQVVADGLTLTGGTSLWIPLQPDSPLEFLTWMQLDAKL